MSDVLNEKALVHWSLINRLAIRRFGSVALAEEAALFVMDSLAENSWKRLQAHSGKGSFTSYLASLSWRLLEDFSRKRFGRVRPPLWVTKLGGIWSQLFSLLCLERLSVSDAVESAVCRYPVNEKDDIEDAAYRLLGRIPECGKQQALEISLDELDEADGVGDYPERLVEHKEQCALFSVLFTQLTGEGSDGQIPEKFGRLFSDGLILSPEERLLLKLLYRDNVGTVQAGVLLGLNRDQVNGRVRRLLSRLRKDFQKRGVADELLDLLR